MTEQTITIGDVAAATGLSVHALRFFEKESLWIRPIARDAAGRRRYRTADVEWIELCMRLRHSGMPIARLRTFVELVREGPGNEQARLELLVAHQTDVRNRVDELHRALAVIDEKVDIYREHLQTGDADVLWSQPTSLND